MFLQQVTVLLLCFYFVKSEEIEVVSSFGQIRGLKVENKQRNGLGVSVPEYPVRCSSCRQVAVPETRTTWSVIRSL